MTGIKGEEFVKFSKEYSLLEDVIAKINSYNKAAVLTDLGKFEEAIESYDLAIKYKPDFAAAYSNKGGAFKKLGKIKEAEKAFHKAKSLSEKR